MSQRFLYVNKLRSVQASLVALSENSRFPASNLATNNYSQVYRSSTILSNENVVQDFGVATDVDTVFLGNVNFTSSATIKIQANATDLWGAPSFEETLVVTGLAGDLPHTNLYHELASTQSFRFWRVSMDDTTNPDAYLQFGEWWLSERITLAATQQHEITYRETYQRGNVEHETDFQNKYVYTRSKRLILEVSFEKITSTTRDELRKLEQAVEGSGLPFIFVQDVSATPYEAFFMRLGSDLAIDRASPQSFDIPLTFIEEARGADLPVVA